MQTSGRGRHFRFSPGLGHPAVANTWFSHLLVSLSRLKVKTGIFQLAEVKYPIILLFFVVFFFPELYKVVGGVQFIK
jgi:hypothetical protein